LKNNYINPNAQWLAMRKVLFVCTANLQRSPTAENLFQGWKGIWEAKSAGIVPEPKGNPLTQKLIDWADLIIVMEPIHSQYIRSHFQCSPDKIRILNIADRYLRDDPKLMSMLSKKVPSILEEY
jgi:predicted protein tyrosine phosphatase